METSRALSSSRTSEHEETNSFQVGHEDREPQSTLYRLTDIERSNLFCLGMDVLKRQPFSEQPTSSQLHPRIETDFLKLGSCILSDSLLLEQPEDVYRPHLSRSDVQPSSGTTSQRIWIGTLQLITEYLDNVCSRSR